MIHIASVHWKSSSFQDIQFEFVNKNLHNSEMWCFLDKIPADESNEKNSEMYRFHKDSGESNHLIKLDILARMICSEAADDDTLMFLDGDCWPVCPINDFIKQSLGSFPVVAVVRTENGEPYPHPSFLFTTIRYWKENGLAWSGKELNGKRFAINYVKNYMEHKGENWLPLRRTGGLSEHEVFFSFYGRERHMVYHHGAGFRKPVSGYCMKKGLEVTKDHSAKMMKCFLEWSQNAQ